MKIFVATHKEYTMPSDSIYQPFWAGAAISKTYKGQFPGDNTGDNISVKNPCFNELTVVYWAWKNCDEDIKGLVHYRRFIGKRQAKGSDFYDKIIDAKECEELLKTHDVIVPYPKRYYVMSIYDHYIKSKKEIRKELTTDMAQLRAAIAKLYPDYVETYDKVMKRTSAHMLNMFIMRREQFDGYCEWLFNILFEVERHILEYRQWDDRVCGAISELMLDIYLTKNNLSIVERPLVELEGVSLIKKVSNRLKRMLGVK